MQVYFNSTKNLKQEMQSNKRHYSLKMEIVKKNYFFLF